MTPAQARVVQAEADARAARERLAGSVAEVQDRLRPAVLVREARRELVGVRGGAADYTIRNPRPVVVGAVIAALLVVRGPLWRLLRRRRATRDARAS